MKDSGESTELLFFLKKKKKTAHKIQICVNISQSSFHGKYKIYTLSKNEYIYLFLENIIEKCKLI